MLLDKQELCYQKLFDSKNSDITTILLGGQDYDTVVKLVKTPLLLGKKNKTKKYHPTLLASSTP